MCLLLILPLADNSKQKNSAETTEKSDTSNGNTAAKTFTFRELAAATKYFRSECLLGEGGFGRVYKGRLENDLVNVISSAHLNLEFSVFLFFLPQDIWVPFFFVVVNPLDSTDFCFYVQTVAVKQLDRNRLQGNKEFHVEVLMLSLLHHQNLVSLIGYCADGDQRLLVYEFMPNGSLEDHLLGMMFTCSLICFNAIRLTSSRFHVSNHCAL